ncbi:MAG TPA: C40 family peptidase [Gemmatimonadales bacterium]|nr:C40 family peptidase [Gemmatimonadales bacterium]
MILRASLFTLLGALFVPRVAGAQGVSLQAGRFFDGDGLTSYQVSWTMPLLGPIGADIGGVLWRGPGVTETRLGLNTDLSLFRSGRAGLYAVGGLGGGFGSGSAEDTWHSWSAGLGYELLPVSFVSLGVEGRWRDFEPGQRSGVEFGLRLATLFGGSSSARTSSVSRRAPAPAEPPAATEGESAGSPPLMTASELSSSERGAVIARSDADSLLADVIQIAERQMGTPYQYGGTGRGDDGFDCSGLIQYAYAQAGITLPRQSRDQARIGTAVTRTEGSLRPGDILTFAQNGRRVTHVGLYIGDGRFIHSASKGVQISTLGTSDPNGRWWYQRWVGVRRVVAAP